MDDMDREVKELGGKPAFFKGEFSKYSWSSIFRPSVSGHELVKLYGEALEKMNHNPNIPQLFRDIFKNAYLPYRDPETLKSFLKVINEFRYSHSEKLGDAFEYLLSILGSQGDAGQFRTPRHIIDFIVEVISPSKTDKILDPACGTAGFLISAYKHIMKNNMKKVPGDTLKPEEKNTLIKNFCGYDISPDMVRLSLVNLYLHGFSEPKIYEYDTLTSEERWNEYYDVILANPPFMSPKGGIKPHKRFSLQAKRSEILFVDYICEHLTPNGKAGIIVPEGIIFQSGTAYKQLRKMLVEKYLWAVVSLPAGVFNPYSGVKTSILLLDKNLSKKTDKILFVKIENDGFDLGAQRREITKNDLPDAIKILSEYKNNPSSIVIPERVKEQSQQYGTRSSLFVDKEVILVKDDCNLSIDRYKVNTQSDDGNYPYVRISEIAQVICGGTPSKANLSYWQNGNIKWISSKHINSRGKIIGHDFITEDALKNSSSKIAPKGSTILITRVSVGKNAFADDDYAINQDLTALIGNSNAIDPRYLFLISSYLANEINNNAQGVGVRGVTRSFVEQLKIPLPPLPVQQEIVNKIEGYQKIIDGARQILDNYSMQIEIKPDWPLKTIGESDIEIIDGDRGKNYPRKEEFSETGYCLFLNTKNVRSDGFNFTENEFINYEKDKELRKGKLNRNDVVLTTRGTLGNVAIYDKTVPYENLRINSGMLILRANKEYLLPHYLFYLLQTVSIRKQFFKLSSGSAQPQLPIRNLININIPIPSLHEQNEVISDFQLHSKFMNSIKEIIQIYNKKISDVLNGLILN